MRKTRHAAAALLLTCCSGLSLAGASAQTRPAPPNAPAGGLSAEAEQMRKQHVEEADRKLGRQNAAAARALGSMCAGCGTQPARTPAGARARPKPLRPEEAPDYEWVPPVDDPD
jgi:hypothetical protein